jgi:hypothetical protein
LFPEPSPTKSLPFQCSAEGQPNEPDSAVRVIGINTTDHIHPIKKRRLAESNSDTDKNALTTSSLSLPDLPYDILEAILSKTGDPRFLLATARTCKELYKKLTHPSASGMWKKLRKSSHIGLPDPAAYDTGVGDGGLNVKIAGVRFFASNEAAYAAFVFDGGPCEVGKFSICQH